MKFPTVIALQICWAFALNCYARLDDSWSVTVGGQQVRVAEDGSFFIPNITTPDQFGESGPGSAPDFTSDDFIRLTGHKTANGRTQYVWSSPFQIRSRNTFLVPDADLTFSDTPLREPEFVRITAPKTVLRTFGETTQLTTLSLFADSTPDLSDNPSEDVTLRSDFTVYRTSNVKVASVSKDGLVTAVGNGTAIITAVNSLVSASLSVHVDTTVPTTIEGFARFSDQSPLVGATVTAQGQTGITDAKGFFSIPNVPSGGGRVDITVAGPITLSRTVQTIPSGISDAGIIVFGAISNQGSEFIVLFQDNSIGGIPTQQLFITSSTETFGTIESPGLANAISFQVPSQKVSVQNIAGSLMMTSNDVVENKGIRIVADQPFQLYGLSQFQATTDAYTAIPVAALGTTYRIMSYTSASGSKNASQLAFVATEDDTTVTITPKSTAGVRTANVPFTIKLNRLQSYQLQANGSGRDLTGSLLTSTKPIAVFSGHICGQVPVGVSACDHMIEQMPATDTWGKTFIAVSLATRRNGDIFRILAHEDDTVVSLSGGRTEEKTLAAGQFYEFLSDGVTLVSSSKPVLFAQFSRGSSADGVTADPFMMIVPPINQFLKSYTFTTPVSSSINSHFVNIVAKTIETNANLVMIDGQEIDSSLFTAIPGTAYSYIRLPITQGDHNISSASPLGIYVYGFGSFDSYGYPGGQAFKEPLLEKPCRQDYESKQVIFDFVL